MKPRGIPVLNAAQMRAADEFTINDIGIPGVVLMENAGRGVVDVMEEYFEDDLPLRAAVFCGKGNNGGDGWVIARHLVQRGHDAVVFSLAQVEDLTGDALINAQIAQNIGLEYVELPDEESMEELEFYTGDFNVAVDAIFGTGLTSAVRGHYGYAMEMLNNMGLPIVAVDIPSGLSSDSGEMLGAAVMADLTVTFAYPKIGLVMMPAAEYVGDVVVTDISIPPTAEREDWQTIMVKEETLHLMFPQRQKDAHKGSYGHGLVVAGAKGKCGAAAMVGSSALLSGSGLITMGVPDSLVNNVDSMALETMTIGLDEEDGYLAESAFDTIDKELNDKSVLALGPGIGTRESTVALVKKLVSERELPLVLDADAVNAFAGDAGSLTSETPLIITPHPGELARLLGITTADVQANRIGVARELAMKNNIIVVLKGYRTIVAEPDGVVYINMSGNSGMATAGAGDVLTGMITALAGMPQFSALEAAVAGVFLHGLAGDLAREAVGEESITASIIMEHIPAAFMQVKGEHSHQEEEHHCHG